MKNFLTLLFRHGGGTANARMSDPETSHAAAASIDTATMSGRILKALEPLGATGATSEELADLMALPRVSVSPRLREMARNGLLVEAGYRPSKSGRSGIVWAAV